MRIFFLYVLLISVSINLYSEATFLAFKCVNKKYFAVDDDKSKVTSSTIGRSETFEVNFIKPNLITIKAKTNKYLCADENFWSKASLRFNRDNAGEWETFEIHPVNSSQVYIKSYNDYYLELKENEVNFWNTNPNENCLFSICNTDGSLYNHNLPLPKTNMNVLKNQVGKKLYKKGDEITLKAPENSLISENDFGKGYDENFVEVDKFNFTKDINKELKEFGLKYERIMDNFTKSWGLKVLGLSLGENKNTSERSLTYSMRYLDRREGINYNNDKLSFTKIVLVGITYGWSLDYRFSGSYSSLENIMGIENPSTFHSTLENMGLLGKTKVETNSNSSKEKVKFEFKMIGFELKNLNNTPIVFENIELFKQQFKPKSVPVYYHFKVFDDFVSDEIEWKAPVIENGIYKLNNIKFSIIPRKKDGSKWELDVNLPNEIVFKNAKGEELGVCTKVKDTDRTFEFNRPYQIDTRLNQNIVFHVFDNDNTLWDSEDDYIGMIFFNPMKLVGKRFPVCEIDYNYDKGQIEDNIKLEFEEK